MKKFLCVIIALILITFLPSCGNVKQCKYCKSTDVKYVGHFLKRDDIRANYFCEECYQENKNGKWEDGKDPRTGKDARFWKAGLEDSGLWKIERIK